MIAPSKSSRFPLTCLHQMETLRHPTFVMAPRPELLLLDRGRVQAASGVGSRQPQDPRLSSQQPIHRFAELSADCCASELTPAPSGVISTWRTPPWLPRIGMSGSASFQSANTHQKTRAFLFPIRTGSALRLLPSALTDFVAEV